MAMKSRKLEAEERVSKRLKVTPVKRKPIHHSSSEVHRRLVTHSRMSSEDTTRKPAAANLNLRIADNVSRYGVTFKLVEKFSRRMLSALL